MQFRKPSPTGDVLLIAMAYALVAGLCSAVSGLLVLKFTTDPEALHRIEQFEELLFIAVTALALFFFTRAMVARHLHTQRQFEKQRAELTMAQHRIEQYLVMASVCHDSNNVLAAFRLALDLLKHDADRGELNPAIIEELGLQCKRLEDMNRRLMEVGRSPLQISLEPLRLEDEIRAFMRVARWHPTIANVDLTLQNLAGIIVRGDPVVLHQILLNLLLNAAQTATDGRRAVLIRAVVKGEKVELEVHDDGPGVPEDHLQEIFQPYCTTNAMGMGLGLLSVRAGARMLNGSVCATRSTVLGGACFTVRLQIAPAECETMISAA